MGMAQRVMNLISSEKVEGTNVFDPMGNKIGEIDHLMIERVSGQVRFAVLSFGGFLGIGHSHYPLPWSSFRFDTGLEGYVTNITEAQLKDAPEYSDDSWTDPEWEGKLDRYFEQPLRDVKMTTPRDQQSRY